MNISAALYSTMLQCGGGVVTFVWGAGMLPQFVDKSPKFPKLVMQEGKRRKPFLSRQNRSNPD